MAPKAQASAAMSGPPYPSVAVAIAIVRSKPAGTAAREYVLKLRTHMRVAQRELSNAEKTRYLDAVDYWQGRCGEVEHRCRELEEQIVKLERRNQLQSDQNRNGSDLAIRSSKRKRDASPIRRAKRTRTSRQQAVSAEETMEDDFDMLDELGESGRELTKHIWTLQKLFRLSASDSQPVCASLIAITGALGRVLSTIARCHDRLTSRTKTRPGTPSLDKDKTEFASSITACARAFGIVLMGLQSLHENSPERRLTNLVICECVKMFATALEVIEASAQQAAGMDTTRQSNKRSRRAISGVANESASARAIAHFLTSLLSFLQKNDPLHQQLFDGFAFVLFERVGKRLFYCTFGRQRSTNVEGDMLPLPTPTDSAAVARQEEEVLAIRFELKALILVLERTLSLAPSHMNPNVSKRNPIQPCRTLSMKNLPASKTRISPLAKERLQRTLVTCMFGEKVEDDFLEVLTMPVRQGPLPNIPKLEGKDVEEWYQKEVWRLVGWDILAHDGGWKR